MFGKYLKRAYLFSTLSKKLRDQFYIAENILLTIYKDPPC